MMTFLTLPIVTRKFPELTRDSWLTGLPGLVFLGFSLLLHFLDAV